MSSNWKLTLAYDGTEYRGWQVQPHLVTVQGTLADAIERITAERVLPQGSGRTDAGVHALAQVASFLLTVPIPAANLHRALNRTLPDSIRVHSAEIVSAHFHARHSAIGKIYEYRIYRGEICPPWLARYCYPLNWPLQVQAMRDAASMVIGEHDFTSFAAVDPDLSDRSEAESLPDNRRTVHHSAWHEEGELLVYRVSGSGFLHHMVRNLVGTFLEIGRSAMPVDAVGGILRARERRAAGPTAPARGLFLAQVEYPPASPDPM